MILVDTSVWVDFFRGKMTGPSRFLHEAIRARDVELLIGDLIVVEVLQGLKTRSEEDAVSAAFSGLQPVVLCGAAIAPQAAANYRFLRRKGVTIRGVIDVIIATWCIENNATLLHSDRDFAMVERMLGLRGLDS